MNRRRASISVRWIVVAAAVLVAGLVIAMLLRYSRPAVTVTEVVQGPAVQAFYATGTLEPADREHMLRSPVDGFIRPGQPGRPHIDKGDRVSRGQVLIVIYNEQIQNAYDKAVADVAEKRARADEKTSPVLQEFDSKISAYGDLVRAAEREFKRYSAGIEAGAATQADYDRALDRLKTVTSDFESFKAQKIQASLRLVRDLAEAESALKTATWNLEQTKILSPVDGFVMDKPMQVGERVAIADLIVTVANTSPSNLVMRAQVDEEDVTKVIMPGVKGRAIAVLEPFFDAGRMLGGWQERSQLVQMSLYAFADQPFVGNVIRIYPKADPERRTFEVDVAIDQPSDRMQAGMTGELMFVMKYKPMTSVVPAQALQDGKIWTIRDGRLVVADAQVGLKGVERVEIVSGLQQGDKVVVSPVAGMEPGQSIRIGEVLDPIIAAALNKPKEKELFRGGF